VTPAALLAAARSGDPVPWAALSDWFREHGSDPAADAAVLHRCERCGVPDGTEPVRKGRDGKWRTEPQISSLKSDDGWALYGEEFTWQFGPPPELIAYHDGDYWHLVCPRCRRKVIAGRAHRTRRANRDRAAAARSLFPE
jgi:hypothetical protein